MVVRIAGYGYQKGFGGHFHNDNAVAVLRDIPGLVIASPARPDDAAAMLRTCVAAAAVGRRGVRLPRADRALPHRATCTTTGDDGWLAVPHPAAEPRADRPRPARYGDGTDLTIVTLRQRRADEPAGRAAGWPRAASAAGCSTCAGSRRCRSTTCCARRARPAGCWSSTRPGAPAASPRASWPRWSTPASPAGSPGSTSQDSFIPLGDAADHVLVSEADIEAAARRLLNS